MSNVRGVQKQQSMVLAPRAAHEASSGFGRPGRPWTTNGGATDTQPKRRFRHARNTTPAS